MRAGVTNGRRDGVGRASRDEEVGVGRPVGPGAWWETWAGCPRWFRPWGVPPRWSGRDWWEEVRAVGLAAAWQALGEYDPARGVPRTAFVRDRIRSRVLTRYRQEWAYGRRCDPGSDPEGAADRSPGPDAAFATRAEVADLLGRLPEAERRLLGQLLLDGRTEADVARELGISQPAVCKRKDVILKRLRDAAAGSDGGDHSRL